MLQRLIILLVLTYSYLHADVITERTTRHAEGTGFGTTREEAVNNAIVEAIGQLNGISIRKKIIVQDSSAETSSSDKYAYKYNSKIQKITQGKADSYSIESVEQISENKYEAVVKIKKTTTRVHFKSPGLSTKHRRKIAIMPFYYAKKQFHIAGEQYSGAKVSDMLSQSLTNDFTQSRRFAVVDRTYLRDMSKELGIITSGQTPLTQKVKLGQKLSADYLLVGTIQAANMHTTNTHNQLLGTNSSTKNAEFIIDYRIIVVGTSQIKWSSTKKAVIDLSSSYDSAQMVLTNAIERVSHDITNELLSNIYPVRVLKVTRVGTIVLNQGGNSLQAGTKMNIMHLGEKMIDPYTHEPLGRLETRVATIEVTDVTPKLSYAKVIEGSLNNIKKNDICRRLKGQKMGMNGVVQDNLNWRKSSVKVESNGGIKLPFD